MMVENEQNVPEDQQDIDSQDTIETRMVPSTVKSSASKTKHTRKPREQAVWKQLAFELYCVGLNAHSIADHPEIQVGYHRVKNVISDEKWWDKKQRFEQSALGLDQSVIDRHYGRKTVDTKRAILGLVEKGRPYDGAFELYGFTADEGEAWVSEDEDFQRRLRQSTRKWEFLKLESIERQGGKAWQATMELLKKHKTLKKDYAEADGKGGKEVNIMIGFERQAWTDINQPLFIDGDVDRSNIPLIRVAEDLTDYKNVETVDVLKLMPASPSSEQEVKKEEKQMREDENNMKDVLKKAAGR